MFTFLLMVLAASNPGGATPLVIAHRGASGYLPEHTLEAYAAAHAMGADYIEQDLVSTNDGVLICLHDRTLESTTNVEEVFPKRKRPDGHWYAADFTLQEIRQLAVHERLDGRFPKDASSFSVPTFAEAVELIQGMNLATGRKAGIYPELKAPGWHREEGLPMEEKLLSQAREHGYSGSKAAIFVQSFEPEALQRLRAAGSELPQVLLLGDEAAFSRWVNEKGLQEAASFADGIGPNKSLLAKHPEAVERTHAAGFVLHPWTFRDDQLPTGASTPEEELQKYLVELKVDGVFTDFPDTAAAFVREHFANDLVGDE